MKHFKPLFSSFLLVICCYLSPHPVSAQSTAGSVPMRKADTVARGALDFCSIGTKQPSLLIFTPWGADIVLLHVEGRKVTDPNILRNEDSLKALLARQVAVRKGAWDLTHVCWTHTFPDTTTQAMLMKAPLRGQDTLQSLYTLVRDTLITELTIYNPRGRSVKVSNKQSLTTSSRVMVNASIHRLRQSAREKWLRAAGK